MIDVVNEAIPSHAPAFFAEYAFGEDWVLRCFELAREHCPNSILILNDYGVLGHHTDAFIEVATPAVNGEVIDGLGLEAHFLYSGDSTPAENELLGTISI